MKIISLQKNLKAALYAVSHIAQKNTSLPILNNVLLSAQEGVIKIIGTNLEIGVTTLLRGKIEKEGSFTVDARVFFDYINLLPGEKVEIELQENELVISCGENKTKIKGVSAEEFPFIPEIDRSQEYIFLNEDFKQAASQVVFAAALDENRVELSGIFCVLNNKGATLVGTDSYRLAERSISIPNKQLEEKNCIIPTRTIQEVLRVLSSDGGEEVDSREIKLYVSENQCLFVVGGTEIVSRLITGRYPDYKQIIPDQHKNRTIVNKEELNRAVKTALLFSKSGVYDVHLESEDKKGLIISAASGQVGEHVGTVNATSSGVPIHIILNARYILDVLNIITGEEIIIDFVDENTPCVFREEKNKDFLYIIMPIKN